MLGETYRSQSISRLVNESFETVIVDRDEQPELAAKLKVRYFPTTIVVGPDNKVIDVIEGYVDSKTFAHRLQTTVAAESPATQKRSAPNSLNAESRRARQNGWLTPHGPLLAGTRQHPVPLSTLSP
jgi:thioredoxin-like negative regulator of GroEL